ncbi:hypothetical protein CCR97_05215 [Rhodoplanes elegans]|uniref:Uncharacterized protein n=1 Tax=Rhodoplanes elegans TaxID=29408 RepID=A0A327KSZ8_9BRAD|nr:hypothetical protein [Rhodoplanes elegans]RAI41054.1 hypothetical protein CH338_04280 [Rhodoplanes elegans]
MLAFSLFLFDAALRPEPRREFVDTIEAGETSSRRNAGGKIARQPGCVMRKERYQDDLSVSAAIAAWRAGEAAFSVEMRSAAALTPRTLDCWLAFHGLTDRLRPAQCRQLLGFLDDVARPVFRAAGTPSSEAFTRLDEINFEAVRAGITTASLMGLLTRFACACAPAVYAPATQRARRGIQAIGHRLPDMSYRSYMLAFMKEHERFADRVATIVLAAGSAAAKRPVMPLDLLVMRALDWRLMMAGGYPVGQLETLVAPQPLPIRIAGGSRPSAARTGRDLLPGETAG